MSGSARRRQFKKGIDRDDSRRNREYQRFELRKSKREESLMKKRREGMPSLAPSGGTSSAIDPSVQERLEDLPQMHAMVMSNDPSAQLEGTVRFRKLLSIERNPPIDQVIQTGIVPRFVQFLSADEQPQLQFEAAWALTNIASGTTNHTQVVIQQNAVPMFVHLLGSYNDDVREQAIWALGNIAGDSPDFRNLVLEAGSLQPLLEQLTRSCKLSMMRNATWTLSNFCRGKPPPPPELVQPALPTLAHLIYSPDEEVLTDACWALSYLSDGSNENIQAVIEVGVCRRIVELLMHNSPAVKTPALRTVGNIVTGDDVQTQRIINCGGLSCLLSLLGNSKKSIRKEACWTISNITAGNKDQIQHVIDSNIIPPLTLLLNTAEFDIRKEAAWAISNATSGGTPQQIKYLVTQGCVPPLCDLLTCDDADIIVVALEALENILRVGEQDARELDRENDMVSIIDSCDGIDKLEMLQEHAHTEVFNKVSHIIDEFFDLEGEDEALAPEAQGDHFSFGAAAPTSGFNFGGMQ